MIGMLRWVDSLNHAPYLVQLGSALTFGLVGLVLVAILVSDRHKAAKNKVG